MGINTGILQALTAGIKSLSTHLLVFADLFPGGFLLQFILGSNMRLSQMTAIILSGFAQAGEIMVSFTPIVVFFVLTGGNYHFLQSADTGLLIPSFS